MHVTTRLARSPRDKRRFLGFAPWTKDGWRGRFRENFLARATYMHKLLERTLVTAYTTFIAGWFSARNDYGLGRLGEFTRCMKFKVGERVIGKCGRTKNRNGTVISIHLQSKYGACFGDYYFPPSCLPELYTVEWDATRNTPHMRQNDILPYALTSSTA